MDMPVTADDGGRVVGRQAAHVAVERVDVEDDAERSEGRSGSEPGGRRDVNGVRVPPRAQETADLERVVERVLVGRDLCSDLAQRATAQLDRDSRFRVRPEL